MRRRFAGNDSSQQSSSQASEDGDAQDKKRPHAEELAQSRPWPHIACLVAAVGFTFAGALEAPYILWLDDVENLVWRFGKHPEVNAKTLKVAVTESCLGVWEPVASVVKLILCAAVGSSEDPWPHLAANVALHAANSCLSFLWLCRIFGSIDGCRWLALGVSLFWAVHPLRAEAVAWISCQPYLLAGLFSLLTLHSSASKRSVAAVACAAAALHCKVPAICLALPLLAQSVALHGQAKRCFAEACSILTFAAAAIAGHAVTLPATVPSLLEVPLPLWPERVLKATYMVWWCFASQAWPSHLAHRLWLPLAQESRLRISDFTFGGCSLLWAFATLAAIVVLCLHRGVVLSWLANGRHEPCPVEALLALVWFAYNGALFPMTKVAVHHGHRGLLTASRYTYLPDLLVLTPCSMCLLFHLVRRGLKIRRSIRLTLSLILIMLLFMEAKWACTEVAMWRTTRDVYQRALDVNPMESFSAFNLAHSVANGYRHEDGNASTAEALDLYRKAMQIAEVAADPVHFIKSGANLGSSLSDSVLHGASANPDDLNEAESALSRALEVLASLRGFQDFDMNFIVRFNLANVLIQLERREEALELYVAAALNTTSAKRWEAFRNAAAMSIRRRDFERATQFATAGLNLHGGCKACQEMLEHIEKVRQGKVKPSPVKPGGWKQKPKRKPAR